MVGKIFYGHKDYIGDRWERFLGKFELLEKLRDNSTDFIRIELSNRYGKNRILIKPGISQEREGFFTREIEAVRDLGLLMRNWNDVSEGITRVVGNALYIPTA